MKKAILLTTAIAVFALTGCAHQNSSQGRVNKASGIIDAGLTRLGDQKTLRAGGSQFSEGIFMGASPERNNAALLPASVQQSGAVLLESRDPMTLVQIAQRLSEITGIPHILSLGPTGKLTSADGSIMTASDLAAVDSAATAGAPGAAPAPVRARPAPATNDGQLTMRPNLRGSLSEVLNQVTNTFDVEWTYSDGRVLFRDYVTRKYQISALPSTSSATSSIGANSISSESSISSDIWSEVEMALGGIVGDGANVSIGKTTGLVTVTAKVSDQNRVEEYIKQLNGVVGQQVSFDVNVFTIVLNDDSSMGVDLQAALNRSNGSISYGAPMGGNGTVGSVNIGVVRGDFSVDAMIGALSSQGKVSVSTRAGATTSNNRVAPINVIDKTAYLKEITVTEGSDGDDDRIERTPGEIETGFQMQLFPRVMNNREVMVQFTVRISELNDIKSFGEGNEAVQLPEVSTTSFEQQAVLENGQTLVLAGFERQRAETGRTSSAGGLFGFGGGQTASTSRVATVMMITPRIVGRGYESR